MYFGLRYQNGNFLARDKEHFRQTRNNVWQNIFNLMKLCQIFVLVIMRKKSQNV